MDKLVYKFNELILEIFNRYLLFEEVHNFDISIEEIEHALKTAAIPIYDELTVEEQLQYKLNIPDVFINLIETNSVLTKDDILSCVDKGWKFYDKLKNTNLHPIYIGKFDFNSFDEINKFLESITDVDDKQLLTYSIGIVMKLYNNANRIIFTNSK
jgi:hypothetical protein